MKFTEINTENDALFGALYALYEQAFPAAERRLRDAFIEKMLHEPRFHCMAIELETGFAGLFTYWRFGSFIYAEHFAINEAMRGQNLGGQALTRFVQESDLPVVLEVELPETDLARRRIAFYERHGFRIVRKDYVQPPYFQGAPSIPMFLMCTADNFSDEQVSELQQAVYGH